MKALILFFAKLLTIFLVVNGVAHGDTGILWSTQSRLQKQGYVLGYLHGKSDAETEIFTYLAVDRLRSVLIGLPKKCDSKCMDSIDEFAKSASQMILRNKKKFEGADTDQVVDGLDKFYADYRNRNIFPDDLIEVAIDSINGASEEWIEKRLEFFREIYYKTKK